MNEQSPPRISDVTIRIIHGALTFTVLVYGGIGWFLAGNNAPAEGGPDNTLLIPLAIVGAVSAVVAVVVFRGAGPIVPSSRDSELDPRFTRWILSWALFESIAIYGLVLMILGAALLPALAFVAASFLLMVLHYPRTDVSAPAAVGAADFGAPPPIE